MQRGLPAIAEHLVWCVHIHNNDASQLEEHRSNTSIIEELNPSSGLQMEVQSRRPNGHLSGRKTCQCPHQSCTGISMAREHKINETLN